MGYIWAVPSVPTEWLGLWDSRLGPSTNISMVHKVAMKKGMSMVWKHKGERLRGTLTPRPERC
jgi:hypothetical protein